MSAAPQSPRNLKLTLILGAARTVGTRLSIKGLGFMNTIIMARMLLPADYGVVAMAMLVVGLIQALMDFGATTALMRKAEVTPDEINSAWTLRIFQSVAVAILMILVAPFATGYFKEPRVEYVLWTLAACVALAGAGNIGVTLAQKQFNFALDFRLLVISKLLSVVATIGAGLYLRDYRALVIGIATGYISGFILSYAMHPYRPRWATNKISEIWAVTKWLMLAGVGGFVLRKGDELMAARIGTTTEFGLYNVGADLGQLPTAEVGPAMLRALLPVLTAIEGGTTAVNSAVLKTVSAVNTITLPIGFGFAAVAAPATALILGPAWTGAVQFVAIFAFAGAIQIIQGPFNTLLLMRGYTKIQNHAVWLEFLVFVVAAMALVPSFSLIGLVWARILGTVVNLIATIVAAHHYCELSLKRTFLTLLRPMTGAVLTYFTVLEVINYINGDFLKICLGIVSGAVIFITWSLASWLIIGKPDGLESTLLSYFDKLFNQKK